MTKIVRRKVIPIIWGIVLLGIIIFVIVNRGIFVVSRPNISYLSGNIEFNTVEEVDGRMILIFLIFFVPFLVLFIRSLLWKLEYDEESFTVKWEGIQNLEYKKIVSIVHYTAHRYRSSIDKFIINYMGISEFGNNEDMQKATIDHYPFSKEMRAFFDYVKEKNPAIEFYCENAGYDGVEKKEFDYFVKMDYLEV